MRASTSFYSPNLSFSFESFLRNDYSGTQLHLVIFYFLINFPTIAKSNSMSKNRETNRFKKKIATSLQAQHKRKSLAQEARSFITSRSTLPHPSGPKSQA